MPQTTPLKTGLFLAAILWALFPLRNAWASDGLILHVGKDFYTLGRHMEILKDKEGKLTIRDVTSPSYQSRFASNEKETPGFGLADSVFWLRFTVKDTGPAGRKWLLEESFPLMDYFDLYVPRPDGSFSVMRAGKMEPFSERVVPNRDPVFPLTVDAEGKTFYIRASAKSLMAFPIYILSPDKFYKRDTASLLGYGLYLGVMLAMALYNFYLFLFLKNRTYLYYVLYACSFAFVQMVSHGFSRQFLFTSDPVADNYAMRLLIITTALCSLLFSRRFLKSSHYAPFMDKVLGGLIITDAFLVPLAFVVPGFAYLVIADVNTALTPLLSASTGIVCYIRGYKPARYYLVARACLYVSIIAFVIGDTILHRHNFFTWYGMLPGSVLDIVLLSLALADRVNIIRQEKEKAEAEAARAGAIGLIGEMAAGVAHEVNNPLAGIILCFQGLKKTKEGDPEREGLIDAVETGLVKIKDTVAQLLNFSRISSLGKRPSDINAMLQNVLFLCKYQLTKENINIVTGFSSNLPVMDIDETRMGQVFANVVLNAAHSMSGGGTLTVHTGKDGKWCEVRISDTGKGIAPADMPRVFDPFFTTKAYGEGTGLGLSLSKRIVEEHGGTIKLESGPAGGATCYIKLPLK